MTPSDTATAEYVINIPPVPPVPVSGGGSGYPMADGGYTGNAYQGDVTVNANGKLVCTVQAECKKCTSVILDNVQLKIGENCTADCGSTIVTVLPRYLTTLKDGAYILRVQFTDGRYDTTITTPLSGALAMAEIPNVPATGGPTGWPVGGSIALAAALLLAGLGIKRRRA